MKNENSGQNIILQLVSFCLGSEEFGIDILKVHEINRMSQITRVPSAPVFIEGIINLRGQVIPVISLRNKLGMDKKELDKDSRIVVVELKSKTVGFIVDSVSEVLRIDSSVVENPPSMVAGIQSDFITSIAKLENKLLILLDLEKVLSVEETKKLNSIDV